MARCPFLLQQRIDPALVDHAILLLEAAERKYIFLLKEAKAQGLPMDAF